jgi:hypothetical protein
MDRQHVCVYNQTNECFLSLGTTLGDRPINRLKRMLGIGPSRVDEGCWIDHPSEFQDLGFFSARDLIYLDADHRVVHVIESYPTYRSAPVRRDTASILALPVHTISSSQTRPGNQLVICPPNEMESRLRQLELDPAEAKTPRNGNGKSHGARRKLPPGVAHDRRRSERTPCPLPISYFSAGGTLAAHVIRDISETGLYLITHERWPIGAEIRMSLQRSDGPHGTLHAPVMLRLRVARWGSDGVGLEFTGPVVNQQELLSMHVC